MRYGTVCSGTEAFGRDWQALGYRCAFHAEVAPHPSAVLRRHYPDTPNHGDFTTIHAGDIDLLAGGTPCQDFSFAGLRAGITGDRGNLTLQFLLLVRRLRPSWVLWENVPGVFSSDEGGAFNQFLAGLAELGYHASYRTLDAQYFGVAQRRRRVFVVGYLGDWRAAAAVLFEPASLSGNTAPGGQLWHRATPSPPASTGADSPLCYQAHGGKIGKLGTLRAGQDVQSGVPFLPTRQLRYGPSQQDTMHFPDGLCNTLAAGTHGNAGFLSKTLINDDVRRLTPREYERLMGWADDWTRWGVDAKGKAYEVPDSPRYKMCGNGWAAPVANWIGQRIMLVDKLLTD